VEKVPHQTNAVLIGKKPVMNYVLAIVRLFNQEGVDEVVVRARGGNIYKAVDAIETTKNLFIKNLKIKRFDINSEELEDDKGVKRRVSSVEIVLYRE